MKRGAPLKRNKPLRPASFASLRALQIRCCGKKRFATQEAAEAALLRIARTTSRELYPRYAYQGECGWWHLSKMAPARDTRSRRRDTGPDRTIRDLVWKRDEGRCAICGIGVFGRLHAIHHRRNRGSGGSSDPAINSPANLLLVCDGPSSCHEWVGASPAEAYEAGYMVSLNSQQDPAKVKLFHAVFDAQVLLTHEGTVRFAPAWGGDAA
jgi:hypothetical protein